jgi:hypothetical protein
MEPNFRWPNQQAVIGIPEQNHCPILNKVQTLMIIAATLPNDKVAVILYLSIVL